VKAGKLIGLAALGLTACGHSQSKSTRYVIDSGASGWVKITYDRKDAPELPVEDGFIVVRISPDMKVVTRSHMNPAWDGSEFYYQSPDGKRVRLSSKDDNKRRLWALEKTSDSDGDREVFFVGKPEQFTQASSFTRETDIVPATPPEPEKEPTTFDPTKIETSLPK
jgi:hypothetical protein